MKTNLISIGQFESFIRLQEEIFSRTVFKKFYGKL